MYEIKRKLQFCYGHRVVGHEGKCSNLHGHNAVIYVYAKPVCELDDVGRVIDFSVLKKKLGGWIDTYWDHKFIYWEKDNAVLDIIHTMTQHCSNKELFALLYNGMFPLKYNPTAENMTKFLVEHICPDLFFKDNIVITKIDFWETENCCASYEKKFNSIDGPRRTAELHNNDK